MRIEQPWYLIPAAAIMLPIVGLGATPYTIAQPWDTLWHFLAYSALTLLLWIATDGRRAVLVPGAVMLLGAGTLEAVSAAIVTAGALWFFQATLKCAESSPR